MYAQAQADRTDTYEQFGLGRTTSPNENNVDFAVYLAPNGQLKVSEMSNIILNLGTYQPGDVFRVSVESGVVKYYKNGTVFYTSLVAPTYPLYFNAAIADHGARILNIYFCLGNGSPVGTSTPTAAPTTTATATATATGNTSNTLIYLHTDHLGSVSAATDQNGAVVSRQEFDPWGKVRTGANPGPVTQTKLNFTGQRLDDTGLLYYSARYYDAELARFVSPDSIVPGASSGAGGAGGTVGAWQNSKLTVDFHESGFASSAAQENALTLQKGFWFQLSSQDASNVDPFGPNNPQALNRYAYVLNNPLRYTDPTGHFIVTRAEARKVAAELYEAARQIREALARGTKGSDLVQFIEDLANIFPGPVQALLELFIHNANDESVFTATKDLLYTLEWMYNWVNWLRDDPDPNAYLDFNLMFGRGWWDAAGYVVVDVHTGSPGGIPSIPREHAVGETLFWLLKNGGVGGGDYTFKIVPRPRPCSCARGGSRYD